LRKSFLMMERIPLTFQLTKCFVADMSDADVRLKPKFKAKCLNKKSREA
jgi:hypothetical protein